MTLQIRSQFRFDVARLVMLLVATFLLGSSVNAAEDGYTLTMRKPADRAAIKHAKERLEIQIFSSMGIGQLKLHRGAAHSAWPKTVVLLIQHDKGQPLKELEGFTLRGKTTRIEGSRRTSGAMDQYILAQDEAKLQDLPSQKAKIRVERTNDSMRVEIPGALLAAETEIEIQWIDYYRS